MTNHEPQEPIDRSPAVEDHEYQEYPMDHARPSNLVVARSPRNAQGEIIEGAASTFEPGWMALGSEVVGGVEYVHVGREDDGKVITERVAADTLWSWQEGHATPEPNIVFPPKTTPSKVDVTPYYDPMDNALTPEQAAALRRQIAEQDAREADPLDGFSDSDKAALREFADAARDKRAAQRAGDGDESRRQSSIMGSAMKGMSEEAHRQAAGIAQQLYGDGNVAS